MVAYAAWQRYDAAIIVGVSVACMGVIAVAFLGPEQLFDSILGLTIFFVAVVLMVACAVIANIYDLLGDARRHIQLSFCRDRLLHTGVRTLL